MSSILFLFLPRLVKKQKFLSLAQKMLDLSIFGLEFEKSILILEVNVVDLIHLQNFWKEQQCWDLESKIPNLDFMD